MDNRHLESLIQGLNAGLEDISYIDINELMPHKFDKFKTNEKKVQELMHSIKDVGLLSPLLVIKSEFEGSYYIIGGKHRYLACRKLGTFDKLPCIIKEAKSDDEIKAIVANSNKQRDGASLIEKAFMIKYDYEYLKERNEDSLHDTYADDEVAEEIKELNNYEKIGVIYNISVGKVKRMIRITKLNKEFLELLDTKKITESMAYEISSLDDSKQEMLYKLLEKNYVNLNKVDKEAFHESIVYLQNDNLTDKDIDEIIRYLKTEKAEVDKILLKDKEVFKKEYKLTTSRKKALIDEYIYENLEDFKRFISNNG